MKPKREGKARATKSVVHGQPSWRLANSQVEAFVTETGGHLGPVTFDRAGRRFKPYALAPWAEEETGPEMPPIIKVLRGDFFCLPFGGNATRFRGETHPVHGETANARWRFESLETRAGRTGLHLSLTTRIRPGRVDKRIHLQQGQNTLYCEHVVSSMRGPMNLGHHAMLKFPDEPGSGLVSTSRFLYGQVFPQTFELPARGGYSLLKPGAEFDSLDRVPTQTGETADLSRYPARRGFEDLVMLVSDTEAPFAWTAVAFPKQRLVWFALKDPRILRQTVLWHSNGGRHYPPWNGRHINVLGLEEVTSWFHPGLAESVHKNAISARGFPTCIQLNPGKALSVRYIMGVAPIPAGFDQVTQIEAGPGSATITLESASGKQVKTGVEIGFLQAAT